MMIGWRRSAGVVVGVGSLLALGPGDARVVRGELGSPPGLGIPATTSPAAQQQRGAAPYDGRFHFARIRWEGGRGRGFGRGFGRGRGAMWAHDFPYADLNFLKILQEVTFVATQTDDSNVFGFDEPDLFRYPISYIVEVGGWVPSEEEVEKLREYLLKGGFLIVDDFRGPRDLANLAEQLRRVLPEARMVRIDETHEIFDSFFRVDPAQVSPPYGGWPGEWYGVFEDNDLSKRMMVIVNANNDMAEYWEFSDRGYYPIDLANEAYKLGVNYVVYGLTH